MPPFADVLKSREVEDPVNLWVHRPLAYVFCRLVYRTSLTPNHVTLLSILLGLGAAALWIDGRSAAMVWGGILLWSSAIMDGADGILARARHAQSAFGRALDGSADWIVGIASVSASLYHLATQPRVGPGLLWLAVPAILSAAVHFALFDFYKEVYVHLTRLDKRREGHSLDEVERLKASDKVRSGPWYIRVAMMFYADFTRTQERLIRRTNPGAQRLLEHAPRTEASAQLYRSENRAPMQLWKALSTAPHAYLFSIFAMFDRIDLYLWLRLLGMNALLLAVLAWQRRSTVRTVATFQARGWL